VFQHFDTSHLTALLLLLAEMLSSNSKQQYSVDICSCMPAALYSIIVRLHIMISVALFVWAQQHIVASVQN